MSEERKVENILEEQIKNNASVPAIFTGIEGAQVVAANMTDLQATQAGDILIRFFYQRPIRLAKSSAKFNPDGSIEYEGMSDALEFALQTHINMPKRAAKALKEQLEQYFKIIVE